MMNIKAKFYKLTTWYVIIYFVVCVFSLTILLEMFSLEAYNFDTVFGFVFYLLLLIPLAFHIKSGRQYFQKFKENRYYDAAIISVFLIAASIFTVISTIYLSKFLSINWIVDLYSETNLFYEINGSFLNWQNIVILITITILAPMVEELYFRGMLIDLLANKYSRTASIISGAIIFAILHLDIFSSLVFGIVLGHLYVRTGSLVIPIFIHVAHNTTVSVIAAFEETGYYDITEKLDFLYGLNSPAFLTITLLMAAICYIGVLATYKSFVRKK